MKALLLNKMDKDTKRKLYAGMKLSVKGRNQLDAWSEAKKAMLSYSLTLAVRFEC